MDAGRALLTSETSTDLRANTVPVQTLSVSLATKVRGLVVDDVFQVEPEVTTRDAAVQMVEKGVGSLLVSGGGGPIGIVTDRDILRKVTAAGRDSGRVKVRDIMSLPLIGVTPEATVGDAVKEMVGHGVKRLAVVEESGAFVGLITMTDIVAWLARQKELSDSLVDYFLYDLP